MSRVSPRLNQLPAAGAPLDPAASHDDDRDQRQEDDGCGRYGEGRDAKGAACRLVGPVFVANRDFAGFLSVMGDQRTEAVRVRRRV